MSAAHPIAIAGAGLALLISLAGPCALAAADPDVAFRLIADLLKRRSPAPDWREQLRSRIKSGWAPPILAAIHPDENGPVEKLVEFWSVHEDYIATKGAAPGRQAIERLLEFCEVSPTAFARLGVWFDPERPDVVARIKKLYETLPDATEDQRKTRATVYDWLVSRTEAYPAELARRAADALVHPENEKAVRDLESFMRLDGKSAEDLLVKEIEGSRTQGRLLALKLLYERSGTDKSIPAVQREQWRTLLREIVESGDPPIVRVRALECLAEPDWSGRVEWILTLFKDQALGAFAEGHEHHEPLCAIVRSAPDFWIPRIVPMVGSSNRNEHNNAVRCLVQFHIQEARVDALRPLLPWLSDPNWASTDDYGRLRLIQSLDRIDLPESVPGLIWSVEHNDGFLLRGAAEALVHYKAKEAVPALKRALSKERDEHHRRLVALALVKLDGFSVGEMADGVVAYAEKQSTPGGRQDISRTLDPFGPDSADNKPPALSDAVTIGWVLVDSDFSTGSSALAALLHEKAQGMLPERPEMAREIERIIAQWNTSGSVKVAINKLQSGDVTADWIETVIENRKALQDVLKNAGELSLAGRSIQALFTADPALIDGILTGRDARAQAMLCAIARLGRFSLPIPTVGLLLNSHDPQCAEAAKLYLEAEDSAAARALALSQHPGKAKILGARMDFDPGHFSYSSLTEVEEDLRQRVLAKNGPKEIHALLSAGYWGDAGQYFILVEPGKAILIDDQGAGRTRWRELEPGELSAWNEFATKNLVDDLAPLNQLVHDGIQYEYVHLSRDGGRRVFMNNPPQRAGACFPSASFPSDDPDEPSSSVYGCIVQEFRRLADRDLPMKLEYRLPVPIDGLKIVLPRETAKIEAVMQHAGKLVALSRKPGETKSIWRVIADGKLGNEIGELMPDPSLKNGGLSEEFDVWDHLASAPWRVQIAEGAIVPGKRKRDEKHGLWIVARDQEPRLLAEGIFASPVASPDGRWVVAAKMFGKNWADPNNVVRVNVATGEATPLSLEPADDFKAVAWVQPARGVLVLRSRDEQPAGVKAKAGPVKSEHYLLDPATGKLSAVTGDFTPLHHETWRPLQATGEGDVVWASVPFSDGRKAITQIGQYDLRNFSFKVWLNVSGLYFTSMDMWFADKENLVYVVINGDLLSFPMPSRPSIRN